MNRTVLSVRASHHAPHTNNNWESNRIREQVLINYPLLGYSALSRSLTALQRDEVLFMTAASSTGVLLISIHSMSAQNTAAIHNEIVFIQLEMHWIIDPPPEYTRFAHSPSRTFNVFNFIPFKKELITSLSHFVCACHLPATSMACTLHAQM